MYKDIKKDRGVLSSAFLSRDTNPRLFHVCAMELGGRERGPGREKKIAKSNVEQ